MRNLGGLLGLSLLVVLAGCASDSPAGAGAGPGDGGDASEAGDVAGETTASDGRDAPAAEDQRESSDARDAPTASADGADGGTSGDAAKEGGEGDAGIEAGKDAGNDAQAGAADAADGDGAADAAIDGAAERVSMPCVAAGACDPFVATSCGARVCAVGPDGNTMCIAGSASPKGLGAACASPGECAGGLDCVSLGADTTLTCQRMCPRGSLGFCGGDYRCTDFIVGCIQYCRLRDVPCDIYAQNCADARTACALSLDTETGERYTGCRPAGPGARGERCDQGGACGKGLLCVRESGVSTCRQICTGDGGALPCLAAGETCSGLTSTYHVTYCH
jgi:hypothetical protein